MYPILSITPQAHEDDLARSALPDAPVVAEVPRRHPLTATRAALAGALRAAAGAVEPAPHPHRSFQTGPGVHA